MHIFVDLVILGFLFLLADKILLEFDTDVSDPVLKSFYVIRVLLHRLIAMLHRYAEKFFIDTVYHTGKLYHLILICIQLVIAFL